MFTPARAHFKGEKSSTQNTQKNAAHRMEKGFVAGSPLWNSCKSRKAIAICAGDFTPAAQSASAHAKETRA
ncbi:MAG: hypothetical protein R3C40_08080 [Parvularculaceae bacterium]